MFVVRPELEPDLRRLREEPELGDDSPALVPDLAHRGNDLLDAHDPDEDHELDGPDQKIADALRTVTRPSSGSRVAGRWGRRHRDLWLPGGRDSWEDRPGAGVVIHCSVLLCGEWPA